MSMNGIVVKRIWLYKVMAGPPVHVVSMIMISKVLVLVHI